MKHLSLLEILNAIIMMEDVPYSTVQHIRIDLKYSSGAQGTLKQKSVQRSLTIPSQTVGKGVSTNKESSS